MLQKKSLPIIGVFILVIILIIFIAGKAGSHARPSDPETIDFIQGIEYLRTLEAKNPASVETILKEFRQQEIKEMREARLNQLTSGEISVWSLFDDYVLLGDSRAVGFEFYEFLDADRVMAESGATIRRLEEHIPDLVEANPSYIFCCYGLNDVSIGIWPTPEDYVADYRRIIEDIRTKLPDTKIFISSILPARDPAFNTSTAWYNIPEYSAAVAAMCQEIGCYYVDNTDICETYADMWEIDGIHVRASFYPYWAANMIMEVYDSELVESEDPGI